MSDPTTTASNVWSAFRAKRTNEVIVDGVYLPPNACAICDRRFPPYKCGVPIADVDRYCWGGCSGGEATQ